MWVSTIPGGSSPYQCRSDKENLLKKGCLIVEKDVSNLIEIGQRILTERCGWVIAWLSTEISILANTDSIVILGVTNDNATS